jgi:hypothetical protein
MIIVVVWKFYTIQNDYLAKVVVVERHLRFRVNILEIPPEALAAKCLSQLFPLRYVANIHISGT